MPEEVLKEIEAKANQYVWENHPVEITHPSEEELKTLPYRSKKELTGDVRIVTWPGMDICACCGVHVDFSGEIGQITLVSAQKFKGGMRIEMLCGRRALEYTNQLKEQNRRISVFNGNDENGYRYIIGEKDGDLREFVKEMNRKLQGRGGGKPFFVQGSVQASRKEIETFFAS